MQFTNLDTLILGAVVFSGAFGLYRGFTREILNLLGILLAAALTYLAVTYQPLVALVRTATGGKDPMIAQMIVGTAVGGVTVITMFVVGRQVAAVIHADGPQWLDRGMGFVFGAARGFLLVVVYLVINAAGYQVMPVKAGTWQLKREFYTYPIVRWASDGLIKVALPYLPPQFALPVSRVRL